MKVTIFTPCYNQGRFLEAAIDSVLAQTFSSFEYLLYDDGSTDGTWEIMQAYAERDARIRISRLPKQKNVGPVINESIRQAMGEYWVCCAADDRLEPTLLQEKAEMAQAYPHDVIYDNWTLIDDEGTPQGEVIVPDYPPDAFRKVVWETSPIGFTGIWIPMPIFKRLPFPEHLPYCEDFYWMVEATINGVAFRNINRRLHVKRRHPESLAGKNLSAILELQPTIRQSLKKKYGI